MNEMSGSQGRYKEKNVRVRLSNGWSGNRQGDCWPFCEGIIEKKKSPSRIFERKSLLVK